MSEELKYPQEDRAAGKNCPICGFWHTSPSCPPQVQHMAQKIITLNDNLNNAHMDVAKGLAREAGWKDAYDTLLLEVKAAMEDIQAYKKACKLLLGISEMAVEANKAYENSLECIRKHIKEVKE